MAASEGVDLEWAIVEFARKQKASRTYSDKIKNQAQKCIAHIDKEFGKDYQIYHSDESIPDVTSTGIFAKPEPKTDIVIISKRKKYFVSVKMEGPIQLASGQGASTAELFKAAADNMNNRKNSNILKSIIESLKSMPTRLLSESNYKRIIDEGNEKIINEFIQKGKIIKDKSYEYWLENNKPQLMASILKFIENNDDFFEALIYESLTGRETLKSYKGASANSIISPSGFYMINDSSY